MTISERLKKLRKALDLTQQEFSDKIGSKRNTVATYEMGRTEPSTAVISLICREFNVNETWLRTGEGEMFVRREPQPLEALLVELLGKENVTEADRILMKNFLELSDASRQEVIAFVRRCAQELPAAPGKDIPVPATVDASGQKGTEGDYKAEARAEAERYYQQLLSEKKREKQAWSANEFDAG